MDLENGLYSQVIVIRRRESDDKKGKDKAKKNFQRKSAKTKCWFDLNHEWLKENFTTHEPYFY